MLGKEARGKILGEGRGGKGFALIPFHIFLQVLGHLSIILLSFLSSPYHNINNNNNNYGYSMK